MLSPAAKAHTLLIMPFYFFLQCRQKTPSSHCGAGMVFAVNSDESSPRNFSAFQQLAEQLNGTATGSSSTPVTSTGGAVPSMHISGIVGVTVVLGALIASL